MDRQPHPAVGAAVEVRVRGEEPQLLGLGRTGHAVDVVMAVPLDMAAADQRRQSKVLLHGDAGLGRQILRRHEIGTARRLAVPFGDAGVVEERTVEAFAGF
jgi:hypothetical protein